MLPIILYILISASFIGLAVVVLYKIPTLVELSDEEIAILANKRGLIQKCREINFRQYFLNLLIRLEKFLRKVKIIFLKIENLLSKWIQFLGEQSRVMTHKSKDWIKHKEKKRQEQKRNILKKNHQTDITSDVDDVEVVDVLKSEPVSYLPQTEADLDELENKKEELESPLSRELEKGALPISELEKPIKEEQKWINLIVENPKNITAYKFLGFLYWKQHNYVDAKASLEMAVKLGSCDRKVKEIMDRIGAIEVKQGTVNNVSILRQDEEDENSINL